MNTFLNKTQVTDMTTFFNSFSSELATKLTNKVNQDIALLGFDIYDVLWRRITANFFVKQPAKVGDIQRRMYESLYVLYKENGMDNYAEKALETTNLFFCTYGISLYSRGMVDCWIGGNFPSIELKENYVLEHFSKADFQEYIRLHKLNPKMMKVRKSTKSNLVKIRYNNTTRKTGRNGIIREGFMKVGNHTFTYDIIALQNNYAKILESVTNKLQKSEEATNTMADTYGWTPKQKYVYYKDIVSEVLLMLIYNPEELYTVGQNISDTRGRSIYEALKAIFNPLSSKDFRALLVYPEARELNEQALPDVYSAISEILGHKPKTVQERESFGELAYMERMYLEHSDDTLHNNIWLERIYANLDRWHRGDRNWSVVIEIDSNASLMAIEGALTNCHTLLSITNVMVQDFLNDAWYLEGVRRNVGKAVVVPTGYASSAKPAQLIADKGYNVDYKELNIITQAMNAGGKYHTVQLFKDFILNNVDCYNKPSMKVHIKDEIFDIYCSRYKAGTNNSSVEFQFPICRDRSQISIDTYQLETKLEPDYDGFKRYFVTLLIHNLDSQIANQIAMKLSWCLTNHDAFMLHPNDIQEAKEIFRDELFDIYQNRKSILKNYFESIGIRKEFKDINEEELTEFSINNLR